jgi:intracellular multiplication protein IcmK
MPVNLIRNSMFVIIGAVLAGSLVYAEEALEELEQPFLQFQEEAPPKRSKKKPFKVNQPPVPPFYEEVFNQSLQGALPLTPKEITALRKRFNDTQAAIESSPDTPPEPVHVHHALDLSTCSTPMVIRLAQGYVTSVVFSDATNQPWPIESYTLGDPQAFSVHWDKKGHVMIIQANTLYGKGNISLMLKGLDVPVMFTLLSGQHKVDYRLIMRVPKEGPNAKQLVGRSLPEQVSTELMNILDGVPPQDSKSLRVIGGDGQTQAWVSGKRFYLRTPLTVLSPAWLSMVSSPDGTHVYELPRFSFISGTYNGTKVKLRIEE